MKAWLFQGYLQKQKLGDDCPWSVGWIDPEGRRRSKTLGSESAAKRFQRKIEGQLAAGVYETVSRKSWEDFQAEYESRQMAAMNPGTRETVQSALNHFSRIAKPVRMAAINSKCIADYVATRRREHRRKSISNGESAKANKPAKPQGDDSPLVSPATINKELRTLRAILRRAVRWGYLAKAPEFEFLREPGKLPTYMPPEDFAKLYEACGKARWPQRQPYPPADWWRGVLVMAYMTGWRIGSILALRWEDVDLEKATALSRHGDNKGKRDQKIPLHPLVVEHLAKLANFTPRVFPWPYARRALYSEFNALQTAAGIKPDAPKPHYGFHDLRRAFATMNAENMTADALQRLMQHTTYLTTQRYINMARQLTPAVQKLYVPQLPALKVAGTG